MRNATEVYAECVLQNPNSAEGLLICLTDNAVNQNNLQDAQTLENQSRMLYNITLVLCGAMAFFMQAGFAMVCAGAVRRKNLQNTMLKNLLDACGAAVAFYAIGYGLAYGDGGDIHHSPQSYSNFQNGTMIDATTAAATAASSTANYPNGFVGTEHFFLIGAEDELADFFFQYTFSAAAATIVAGTLAERCQMRAYFFYSILLSGIVYPIAVHTIWSSTGYFSTSHRDPLFGVGVVDIAGSGVVHMTGGITALLATYVLGPRRGRFHDEHTGEELSVPKEIKGHNIGLQLLGTMILWFGWYGFNSGSAFLYGGEDEQNGDILMSMAVTNTTIAAGAAGCVTLFVEYYVSQRKAFQDYKRMNGGIVGRGVQFSGKFDLLKTMNGVLGGLVSITGGCAIVQPYAALIIGSVAGCLYLMTSSLIIRVKLDDAVDAIPVHMTNGIWGMLSVGLLASPDLMEMAFGEQGAQYPGWFYGNLIDGSKSPTLFKAQIVGVLFLLAWAVGTMYPFFLLLERLGMFRVNAREEVTGLDKHYFGEEQQAGGNGGITAEQVMAITEQVSAQVFKNHHGQRRRRRSSGIHDDNRSTVSSEGHGSFAEESAPLSP